MYNTQSKQSYPQTQMGTSNSDRAGWLWGWLAQVSTSKKAHVHLATPAS